MLATFRLAQTALAHCRNLPEDCVVARGQLEIVSVSYRELAKVVGTSLLISSALTAAMFAPWVLFE
jgi:hypothetical protein